jgi:lipopolysaccharide/colanic/teichoic acid biosynthesis glycosyltransferase
MKRFFDILYSGLGLIVLSPLFLLMAILIKLDSIGPVFFKQNRVGLNNRDFLLYKFRSMRIGSDKKGLITVGSRDPRVTRTGYYFRKYKLDELPQLINVLKGDMSLVGPRPEVRKYVASYTEEQMKVLSVKPGVTDYASIEFADEDKILGLSDDPKKMYVEKILPAKIKLNMKYINNHSNVEYFKIIFLTLIRLIRK